MPNNVSTVPAQGMDKNHTAIPSSLLTALSKQQDKLYILHLEKDLIKFIKNSVLGNIKQPEYIIQAQYLKNSYYRLLSHQLCQYYNLQHWNNTFNEIIVTPIPNFDYQQFIKAIESSDNNEGGEFVKIVSVAHKYKSENTATTTNNNTNTDAPEQPNKPAPIKKLMVRKIINKPVSDPTPGQAPGTPESEVSDLTKELDESKLILEDTGLSTPISESSENTTNNIESQRASKEALYMKLREEIFENNNEEEEEEEEEEEDGDYGTTESQESNNRGYKTHNNFNKGRNHGNYSGYKTTPYQQQQLQHQPPMYNTIPMPVPYQFNPNSQGPPIPGMIYSPYYQPMMYGYAPNYPGAPTNNNNVVPAPKYDKETERRILNNPYIILPNDTKNGKNNNYSSKHTKHKKQFTNTNI